jgi:uncharacterized protein (TIGR02391 family)
MKVDEPQAERRSENDIGVITSPDTLYRIASDAIWNAGDRPGTLDIAALHGHAERREVAQSELSRALMEAMLARVAQGWRLRRIVSITTEARLERELAIISRIDGGGSARVEVRVLVTDSVPVLAPLVIGESMAFLAAEDPRDFGVYESLLFRDRDSVAFCARYFDSLWNDDRAIRLRTQGGLRPDGLQRVRRAISGLPLGATAAMANFHPEVRDRCAPLYAGGNYAEAVEKSFKTVRDRLRSLTGHETGSEAFGKAGLRVEGASAAHVADDFNEAVKFLTMAIDRFRNEKAHTADGNIDDPVRALEYLSMSSLALRLLDRAAAGDKNS